MEYRAIPKGYMTVGELAKKMNTTVRTLQYYDKEGLLTPSAESEGGRRLYTDKDMVKLHQILSMKYLGFSLDEIKGHLASLDTPDDVARVLGEQARIVKEKIATLTETLRAIEALREETLRMHTVDFKKYADIIVLLQLKNDLYWVVKHFDDNMLEHIRENFSQQSGLEFVNEWKDLCDETAELQKNGISPLSEQGQAIAKTWWDIVIKFTGGNMAMLPQLMEFAQNRDNWDNVWKEKYTLVEPFLMQALEEFFKNMGQNPFEGVSQ